jgi:hypothetical protein
VRDKVPPVLARPQVVGTVAAVGVVDIPRLTDLEVVLAQVAEAGPRPVDQVVAEVEVAPHHVARVAHRLLGTPTLAEG